MAQQDIIQLTEKFVQKTLHNAEGGHDWWHILRVWNNAKNIAQYEKGLSHKSLLIIELGALLHDIADAKFHGGDEEKGPQTARTFLEHLAVEKDVIQHVENIIRHISFKGGNFDKTFHSHELAIVQDADRLDAIGAIGIARTFNYGGFKNREMYNPHVPPELSMTKEAYKNSTAPTINHFYEKLLLLKDRMNTETGKKMAAQRHAFMEDFLAQFYAEWEGSK
jgi:uncharacterized protein